MGRLAELAGAEALKGKVSVTDDKGVTRTFDSEAEALEFVGGRDVEHKRGGFFCKAGRSSSSNSSKKRKPKRRSSTDYVPADEPLPES